MKVHNAYYMHIEVFIIIYEVVDKNHIIECTECLNGHTFYVLLLLFDRLCTCAYISDQKVPLYVCNNMSQGQSFEIDHFTKVYRLQNN